MLNLTQLHGYYLRNTYLISNQWEFAASGLRQKWYELKYPGKSLKINIFITASLNTTRVYKYFFKNAHCPLLAFENSSLGKYNSPK